MGNKEFVCSRDETLRISMVLGGGASQAWRKISPITSVLTYRLERNNQSRKFERANESSLVWRARDVLLFSTNEVWRTHRENIFTFSIDVLKLVLLRHNAISSVWCISAVLFHLIEKMYNHRIYFGAFNALYIPLYQGTPFVPRNLLCSSPGTVGEGHMGEGQSASRSQTGVGSTSIKCF